MESERITPEIDSECLKILCLVCIFLNFICRVKCLYIVDYADLKSDERRLEHFMSLCRVLNEFLKDIMLPNSVELLGIYGRVHFYIIRLKYLISFLIESNIVDVYK